MPNMNALAVAAATASLFVAGCGEARTDNSIDNCYSDGTNVQPTYVATKPNYSRGTDPYVLLRIQKEQAAKPNSGIKWVGLGTLVCTVPLERPSVWSSEGKRMQVLTQTAIQLSNGLHPDRG